MKNRNGFVTNSSSSSFIVKVPLNNESVQFDIRDEKTLRQWFVDYIEDGTFEEMMEEPCYERQYNEFRKILDSGFGVVIGSISNDDYYSDVERLVSDFGFKLEWMDY